MAESHVVSALVDKRAELTGQIVRIEQQLGQIRADLVHIDATIRLFAPKLEPETIQPKVTRAANHAVARTVRGRPGFNAIVPRPM